MAATKSAKRSAARKRAQPKSAASKKKSSKAAKTRSKKKQKGAPMANGLQRQARKGLTAACKGLDSMMKAGEKTWRMLKTTTES